MNLNIKTTNFSLTPAISSYLDKKLSMLNKYADLNNDNVLIQAELGKSTNHHKSGDIFRAEVNIRISGHMYRAVSEQADLYAAMDLVKDELAAELKKGKEKRKSVFKRGALKVKNILRFGKEEI
jgi:putative sigma-54 modulation protein